MTSTRASSSTNTTSSASARARHAATAYARAAGDRPGAVRVFGDDAIDGVAGRARFDWDALDTWFREEEAQVIVHPRNPYLRVDALPLARAPSRASAQEG